MTERDELVSALAGDLGSAGPATNSDRLAVAWLFASLAYVVLITHLLGPIRPGALSQLVSHPRFALEMVLGLATLAVATLAAFRAAVPGALTSRFALASAGLVILWIVAYVVGLVAPALEPSMMGKRDHCFLETFLYALPPAGLACYLCWKYYPLEPSKMALRCGLAAGLIPALYMQIACMYDPGHILLFHILPGLSVALATLVCLRVFVIRSNQVG